MFCWVFLLGGLGSSNAPRLLDGGAYDQPCDLGILEGLLGRVAGAVIGEPLDRMQKTIRGSKPRIQALHHQVPDEGARDSSGSGE